MPKPNIRNAPRKPLPEKWFDLTDPGWSEPFQVGVRALTIPEVDLRDRRVGELCRLYVFGGWTGEDGVRREHPQPFMVGDSEEKLSEEVVRIGVQVEMCQIQPDRFTWDEVAAMSLNAPDAFVMLADSVYEVVSGKVSTVVSETPSAPSPERPDEAQNP